MHFHNSSLKFIDKKFLLKAQPYFRLPFLQEDFFPTTSYTYTGDKNGVIVAINCLPWTWKCGKPEGKYWHFLPIWFHAQPLNNNKYGSIVHSIHSKVITVQSFYFQFLQTLKLGYLLPLCQASRSSHSYSLVSPPAAPSCDISWFNCPKICPT